MDTRRTLVAMTAAAVALTASIQAKARNEVIEHPKFETRTNSVLMRGLLKQIPNVRFGGSLASINRELNNAPKRQYLDTYAMAGKLSPEEAKEQINQDIDKWKEAVDKYKSEALISEKAGHLLDLGVIVQRAYNLLDYDMFRRFQAKTDSIDEERLRPLPLEYYRDFMTEIMTQDTALFSVPESGILLNRIAFSGLTDRFLGPKK